MFNCIAWSILILCSLRYLILYVLKAFVWMVVLQCHGSVVVLNTLSLFQERCKIRVNSYQFDYVGLNKNVKCGSSDSLLNCKVYLLLFIYVFKLCLITFSVSFFIHSFIFYCTYMYLGFICVQVLWRLNEAPNEAEISLWIVRSG